jgi:predicted nucleic acid binding AN1-type Zn finger protein
VPTESITNDINSKSESEEIEKTAEEDEIDSTVKNVIKSQSPEETKRLRFPCSYCGRRFETLKEVKRHIINGHTPRHAG